jgi:hypothetical protein
MNMPMPPTPPGGPPPPPPAPPPGYNPYAGGPGAAQPKNNGLGIAGFVLSLVGLIPCFWLFQIPGVLGLIFSAIGRSRIKKSGGTQKGAGLALAGLIISLILVVGCVLLWVLLVASGDCTVENGQFECVSGSAPIGGFLFGLGR